MVHYRIQIAVRSFRGSEKVEKTDIQKMPENGMLMLNCNALKPGQYYKVSLVELDKVAGEPPFDPETETETETKPEPKFDQKAFVPTTEPKQDQSPDQA